MKTTNEVWVALDLRLSNECYQYPEGRQFREDYCPCAIQRSGLQERSGGMKMEVVEDLKLFSSGES